MKVKLLLKALVPSRVIASDIMVELAAFKIVELKLLNIIPELLISKFKSVKFKLPVFVTAVQLVIPRLPE
jgi:hypothetical protein